MVDVSIVIVNHNRPLLTKGCVESIYEKTKELTFEIVVVDNGSSEGNLREIIPAYPNLRVIHNDRNIGFSAGNNCGIRETIGEYIVLLNNDTLLINNAVGEALAFLKKNSGVGVVSGRLTYPDGNVQHCCQRFPSIKYKILEVLRIQKFIGKKRGGRILMGSFFDHNEIAFPDWVWGTFFMFPRTVLRHFPNECLPETFFMYWEDVQWCWEIKRLGYKIAFTPHAKVIHFLNGSGGAKNEMMLRNENIFMQKYFSTWQRFLIGVLDKCLSR